MSDLDALLGVLRGRRIVAYHDHNAARTRPGLLEALGQGQSVAYCSDAGTPLVADPGFALARDAAQAGARVHAVPGPSALLAALTVAGQPSDRFLFARFPPPQSAARKRWLADLLVIDAGASVEDVQQHLGHSSVITTMTIYAKIRPGRSADLAAKLDQALIAEP